MNKIKALFLILFILQLAVPLSMIIQKEMTLYQGEIVKFQVKPVDPYDAFRGKYLNLGVINDTIDTNSDQFFDNQEVYVLLTKDSEGFVSLKEISKSPFKDSLYIKCRVNYRGEGYVRLNFPFDRYYLNEKYSKMGEKLYNKFSNGNREDAYITVRIKKGKAVLEDMYLSGREINLYIEDELKKDL